MSTSAKVITKSDSAESELASPREAELHDVDFSGVGALAPIFSLPRIGALAPEELTRRGNLT